MAVRKTILDVDLGGEKLKAALATLLRFKATAAAIPAAIAQAGRAAVRATAGGSPVGAMGTGSPVAAGGGAGGRPLTPQQEEARGRRQVQTYQDAANATKRMSYYWQLSSHYVREIGRNLGSYTGTLLRWTGIMAAAKGLLVGGSVWGLERLASSAYAGRRSSSGLGIGYGEQSAFGLAYERLINSGGLLAGVSQARGNLTSEAAGALYSLGINPAATTGNTGSVSNDVLLRVRRLAQQTPESELGVLMQSRRLGELGFDVESLRRLKNTSDDEFSGYQRDYERRSQQLAIQDSVLRRWQDLDVQLDATAQKLKNGLLVMLEALAKPLGDVSEALGNFFQSIAGSQGVKAGIDYLARGITYLADYIGKDDFKQDVKLFVESVGMLAQKTVAALRYLGVIPDPGGGGGSSGTAPMLRDTPGHWLYRRPGGAQYNGTVEGSPAITPTRAETRVQRVLSIWDSIMSPFTGGKSADMEHYMRAIKMIESGSATGNYGAIGPQVRYKDGTTDNAHGAYGVMGRNLPDWTRRYLGREMTPDEFRANPGAQDELFRKRWEEMLRKYGNPQDAASEWHSGVDLRTATAQKRHDGSMATSAYVNQFNRNLAGQGVSININNNTGGNATVTVAPMGLGAPNY